MAAEPEKTTPTETAPPKKRSLGLIVGFGVMNLLALGVAGFALLKTSESPAAEEHAEPAAAEGEKAPEGAKPKPKGEDSVELKPFVVNLLGSGVSRFLRVHVTVATDSGSVVEEINEREPELRDHVLTYLAGLSAEQIKGSEGMEQVRVSVRKRLNNVLQSGQVTRVFITEMIIQ